MSVLGVMLAFIAALQEGQPLLLRCQKKNPAKAIRPEELNPRSARILLYMGLGLLAAGLLLYFIGRV